IDLHPCGLRYFLSFHPQFFRQTTLHWASPELGSRQTAPWMSVLFHWQCYSRSSSAAPPRSPNRTRTGPCCLGFFGRLPCFAPPAHCRPRHSKCSTGGATFSI